MKHTKEEVSAEVAALKKLNPIGPFARKTAETIRIQIDALSGDLDETAAEFFELTDEQQMDAMDAINWKNGDAQEKPSEGWGLLVA